MILCEKKRTHRRYGSPDINKSGYLGLSKFYTDNEDSTRVNRETGFSGNHDDRFDIREPRIMESILFITEKGVPVYRDDIKKIRQYEPEFSYSLGDNGFLSTEQAENIIQRLEIIRSLERIGDASEVIGESNLGHSITLGDIYLAMKRNPLIREHAMTSITTDGITEKTINETDYELHFVDKSIVKGVNAGKHETDDNSNISDTYPGHAFIFSLPLNEHTANICPFIFPSENDYINILGNSRKLDEPVMWTPDEVRPVDFKAAFKAAHDEVIPHVQKLKPKHIQEIDNNYLL